VDLDASLGSVVQPIRDQATGVALDRDLQVVAVVWERRHRVAAPVLASCDIDLQRQELTRPVLVALHAVRGHVEHQRHGVAGLTDHALDAQWRELLGCHRHQSIKYL
jgi:hypothetical protein